MRGALWFILGFVLVLAAMLPGVASAEYVPLVQTGFLDGVRADVQTAAGALLAVIISILGVGLIIRTLNK